MYLKSSVTVNMKNMLGNELATMLTVMLAT